MNRGFEDSEVICVIGADCCAFFSSSKTLAKLFSADGFVDLFFVAFLVAFFATVSVAADFSEVVIF
jgi:hypothetical protein